MIMRHLFLSLDLFICLFVSIMLYVHCSFVFCGKTHYLRELWWRKEGKCILFIFLYHLLYAGKFCTWKDLLERLPRVVRIGFGWAFHFSIVIKTAADYHVQPVLQLRRTSFLWVSLLWCDLFTEVWRLESSERWFNISFTLQLAERALWPTQITKQH